MITPLTDIEARVLGVLVEKETTTPDAYPVTLNYLTRACNQRNNRHPVTDYDESTVEDALTSLRLQKLVVMGSYAGARQPKYEHSISQVITLTREATAVLAELLIRGPQTPGELRARADRIYPVGSREDVEATLDHLAGLEHPLVTKLPRQHGHKESRYIHLLCGPVDMDAYASASEDAASSSHTPAGPTVANRLYELETTVTDLKAQIETMRAEIDAFRKQFE